MNASLRLLALLLVTPCLMSAEQAFPPTPPGQTEIKVLPAGLLIRSRADGNYFDASNNLFRPLFSTISQNKISMTTPVEAGIKQASMSFWIAPDQRDRLRQLAPGVEAIERPAITVASIGGRGSYSPANYAEAVAGLSAWLEAQPGWRVVGEPNAVYWHGPMMPGPFKRFEVHVPVEAVPEPTPAPEAPAKAP